MDAALRIVESHRQQSEMEIIGVALELEVELMHMM